MPDPRYAEVVAGADLAYVSDYLSFVGGDARGRVAFALDTNRGHDPEPGRGSRGRDLLQAEHAYAVLHDEHAGWVPLSGVQRYPHPGPDVTALPDSPWFGFAGTPGDGWQVRSATNDLHLQVEPLVDRLVGRDDGTLFVMRSAAATLAWRGRVLRGRVVHEGLASTTMNLLTRRTFRGLAGLEFLYLLAGDAGSPWGDLYLQKALTDGPALGGLPAQTGFASPAGQGLDLAVGTLLDVAVTTTGHRPGRGLYRWPTGWAATWGGPHAGRARLRTVSRTTVGQYGVAGFGMSVVTGTWERADGSALPLYGFGELLAAGPVMRWLARR